ncbi:TMhelix containing protein [Escherichia coli]
MILNFIINLCLTLGLLCAIVSPLVGEYCSELVMFIVLGAAIANMFVAAICMLWE